MSDATPSERPQDGAGRDPVSGRFGPGNAFGEGSRRHRTARARRIIADAIEGDLAGIVAALKTAALAGDVGAGRALLDRAAGTPRPESDDPVALPFAIDKLTTVGECNDAGNNLLAAVAAGQVSLEDAQAIGALIESHRRGIADLEMAELRQRLETIERDHLRKL